jgi:uncharacterized sulfatase
MSKNFFSLSRLLIATALIVIAFLFSIAGNHFSAKRKFTEATSTPVKYNNQVTHENGLMQLHQQQAKKSNAKKGAQESRPNILFFLADDMMSIACEPYGSVDVHTPNLTKLAKAGLCFDNMNNATAMCGPTRQSLYTGIFPVKNGSYPNHAQVYDNIVSIAQHFTGLGYRVALIGKQHYAPMSNFPFEYLGGRNSDNGDGQDIELRNAEKFINKDNSKPYLLIVATNQPHTPWNRGNKEQYSAGKLHLPPFLVDTKETRTNLVKYYAEITYADSLVGDCLQFVEKSNNKDNTLFIFASEHGSSLPFGKWTCYNMGLKAAFIASWPKVIKPNTRTDILAQYIDVLPTLYEAAGGDPKTLRGNKEKTMALDGTSFLSTLKGKNVEIRNYVYGVQTTRGISNGSNCYPVRSIQDHNYKLIWNLNYTEEFLSSGSRHGSKLYESWLDESTVTKDEFAHAKLYRNRPEFELYDIKNDRFEMKNLIEDKSLGKIREKLFTELKIWMNQQGDKGIETEWKALTRFKGDTTNWQKGGD